MIRTVLRIGFLNLRRDRVALSLKFVLPVIFFSIFASVFGSRGDAGTAPVNIAVVDEDRSEFSARLIAGLRNEKGLDVRTTAERQGAGATLDRAAAEQSVRRGDVPVAVVIPAGLGESFAKDGFTGGGAVSIQLLSDVSDPIAPQMVQGLLQKVTMTAAPDLLMQGGMRQFEQYAGALTPQQKIAVDGWIPSLREQAQPTSTAEGASQGAAGGMGVRVEVVDVMRSRTSNGSLISFYAAGVGVMFLLFSSVAGAGGALLDEAEAGTLERILSTNVSLTGLLAGKWIFLALGGVAQLTVMFLWGSVVFGVPLFSHLPGFFVMTIVTAGAAAALGLVLATLARTREQLSGFSTILVLTMSALGGSMFPRFLMSETMQKVGLLTFNAWALDGYLKVFWRDAPVWQLWPQVLVLCSLTGVFLGSARVLARRWEAA
ncbi:MAG: ABC transporter permease [Acidobacteriota bacterium]|nr:ABC transporter permease [Acidobacteriota bacterium]